MTLDVADELRDLVRRVPELAHEEDLRIEPLTGVQSLNNSIWVATLPSSGERFAVRIANPNAVEHLGVSRHEEFAAAHAAASVGVGPEVLYFDRELGHMVTRWIDSGAQWEVSDFREHRNISRVAHTLRSLHSLMDIPGDPASVFRRIDRLFASVVDFGLELPQNFDDIQRRSADIELERAADTRRPPGLNHNDFWANNLLDDGRRLVLVDWEFAGRGDGFYDLATTSTAGEYGPELNARLLGEYGLDRPDDARSLQKMIWIVALFEAGWSLVMHGLASERHDSAGNTFDYAAHAKRMFATLADFPR
jgi:thiamine kinase-like enzyme